MIPTLALHQRSYGALQDPDRHAYAQLVLPVAGEVRLDIEGKAGRLDPVHGALVPPGAWHAQCSAVSNRSLILDVDAGAMTHGMWARLLDQPFMTLSPAARKLIDYLGMMSEQHAAPPAVLQGWLPLLLDTLALVDPQPVSRLAALLARIQGEPGLPWTTDTMARCAGVSVSRLHALFREELDATPHAWLLQQRLEYACTWLAGSGRQVADIALAAGFADQSALTKAMRQAMDTTPAAYRKRMLENLTKTQ
ncbi:AraC family transcriptional regulator [Pseudoduganella ginsengisoli]|uniref:Helix-turn-helix domain-containing protein n=1 Tax=Pseudoduganella ginsengisoli TaxID=1462440 RepID=A0A6L6Q0M0_9BURK|nr:AraC family transcriptional regulator [Pseudoduganella ginsengisoli]MTW03046.1 helix-turn-helix domain-containing protein [Pseudoduganella ginsengisoli]